MIAVRARHVVKTGQVVSLNPLNKPQHPSPRFPAVCSLDTRLQFTLNCFSLCGSLSPEYGASSGCGWGNGIKFGG